ncbi:GPP34 family phosphoprotein [Streptomyces sp. NPDC006739]|uniref:GOLPH3/VPS74 family protein n=1 Tax=Streptomyces sp. NPDC006739 TaxID=3364763 RepID=UPI0036A7ABC0
MTTPRDLLIVSLDTDADRSVPQGDLSLALAGAELVDLLGVQALSLHGERIVPGARWALEDRLLDQAVSALVRQAPYESVEDWLWRRGRGLSSAYVDVLEAEGEVRRERHRWAFPATDKVVPADSPARRRAADRWASGEPVLAGLGAALGLREAPDEEAGGAPVDDAVVSVLAAVGDAVTELEAVRQRRQIEQAAFDNIWRGH